MAKGPPLANVVCSFLLSSNDVAKDVQLDRFCFVMGIVQVMARNANDPHWYPPKTAAGYS